MSDGAPGSFLPRWGFVLRLGAWYAVFYFTTFLLLSYLGFRFIRHSLILEDIDLIEAQIVDFRAHYAHHPEDGFSAFFSQPHRALFGIAYARLVSPRGEQIISDYPLADRAGLLAAPIDLSNRAASNLHELPLEGGGSIPVRVFSFPLGAGTSVEIARNERPHNRLLEAFLGLSLMATIPLAAIGLLGGAVFTKWSLQPVRRVNQAIVAILRTGSFDQRVRTKAHSGEIGDLVDLCNRLLAHSERLMNGMRQALDNVAHDLRTPLTRLRVSAETALLREGAPEAHREALADCMEESEQIQTLLNTLMDVAAAESRLLELHYEEFAVDDLIERVTDLYEFVAEEKKLDVRTVMAPGLRIQADPQRLRQALTNLVDNALKYTPVGGHVVISAQREGERIVLAVKDDGIGIAPNEHERIWDRLYRSDSSRHEKGLGLGLSMVKAIVVAHGGSIELDSRLGQGAEFRLVLPEKP